MAHLVLYSLAAVVVAVWGAGTLAALRRRRARSTTTLGAPISLVRILTSDDELREAIDRAAGFEKMVAETVQARRHRYETMVPTAKVSRIVTGSPPVVADHDEEIPRSA